MASRPVATPWGEGWAPRDEALGAGDLEVRLDVDSLAIDWARSNAGEVAVHGAPVTEVGTDVIWGLSLRPQFDYFFVMPAGRDEVARSGWVSVVREEVEGLYSPPALPLEHFIRLVIPAANDEEISQVVDELGIAAGLPEPGTDASAVHQGVRLHLYADGELVYLVATEATD